MVAILQKNSGFTLLILFLFLVSCSDNVEFSKYESLPNASWEAHKNISFNFEITDTISPKDLFINIRNNRNYAYSNLYIISELDFPNGTKIIDTLQYEMTDNAGKFLGEGFTDIKENKLFYKENKVFPIKGKYEFKVHHAMRKNGELKAIPFLDGVQDVGFSIEKVE